MAEREFCRTDSSMGMGPVGCCQLGMASWTSNDDARRRRRKSRATLPQAFFHGKRVSDAGQAKQGTRQVRSLRQLRHFGTGGRPSHVRLSHEPSKSTAFCDGAHGFRGHAAKMGPLVCVLLKDLT